MRVIHWNISYSSKKEKIMEFVKEALRDGDTLICLQEVMESTFDYLFSSLFIFGECDYSYSLSFRQPGKYDGRNRRLGVLMICPKSMYIIDSGVLFRSPFPDRTIFAEILYQGEIFRILSLHSITGCSYSRAKGTQFCSFAEMVDSFKPDIVTVDANEPKVDHFDVSRMVFYDNQDKGEGVRTFFNSMVENGLKDSYTLNYDRERYVEGKPLTTSIKVRRKGACRYDFLFIKDSRLPVESCEYLYEEGVARTSDHAIIVAEIRNINRSQEPRDRIIENSMYPYNHLQEKHLLKFCRYYPEKGGLMAQYEHHWIEDVINGKGRPQDYVNEYDFHELEIFNPEDGVPLSLKALLFNRYFHWSSYATINSFKHWYLENYLSGKYEG